VPISDRPTPNRVLRGLLLGAVAGLVIGAGGIGLAWALSGGVTAGGAHADAEAACAAVNRSGEVNPDDEINIRRWISAGDLAVAAAAADPAFTPLADALSDVTGLFIETGADPRGPEAGATVDRAKRLCADLAGRG
jgi:hypothetical protein